MDFTANPFVALYFCCESNQDVTGAVWLLHETNYRNYVSSNSQYLEAHEQNTRTDTINDIMLSIRKREAECIEYPVSYIPYYIDSRMAAQQSRFLIWGSDKNPLDKIISDKKYYLKSNELPGISTLPKDSVGFLYKIEIAASAKPHLLKQLNIYGINEKSLFPGLDGIGKYIYNYYAMSYQDYIDTTFR